MDAVNQIVQNCLKEIVETYPAVRSRALSRLSRAAVWWATRSLPDPPDREVIARAVDREISELLKNNSDYT